MSKLIQVTIKGFEGSVTIADPLTLSQAHLVEDGMIPPKQDTEGKSWFSAIDAKKLPAVMSCVEKWEIPSIPSGFIERKELPASPRVQSHKLIIFIFNAIRDVYMGEIDIPNE